MSNEYFQELSEAEYLKLIGAIPLITVLIAGADGEVRKNELEWAAKVTKIRGYKMTKDLAIFYKEVGLNYAEKLEECFKTFPETSSDSTRLISDRLSQLNPILAKLHPKTGAKLYRSYLSFAKHVAKASGGFLGFFTINSNEAKLIGVPMLNPVIWEDEEEE